MELQDIYNLLETHLGNCIDHANGKMKRVKLPIPEEYGGGFATGFGYEEAVKNLIERVKSQLNKDYIGPILWNRCKKIIDLKGATSHSFRASYATMMNAHCDHIDIKALQGALRHKTPDLAIKVYTKENISKTRQAEKEYDIWLKERLAK